MSKATWADDPPKEYAKLCRSAAERSTKSASRQRAEAKPWSEGEAKYFDQQARRCRAMALLCENSKAERAGDIDFRGLDKPELDLETQIQVIESIERSYPNEANQPQPAA
jgi:hypothetical protein